MKIKIGPIRFEVVEVENLMGERDDGTKVDLHGEIVYKAEQIRLDQGQGKDIKVVTLWHEIMHGILSVAGHYEQPEEYIDALAHSLVELVRENPELLDYTRA